MRVIIINQLHRGMRADFAKPIVTVPEVTFTAVHNAVPE
jgi:hypothetical protein